MRGWRSSSKPSRSESASELVGVELDGGKVAVVLTCDAYEIEGTTAQLSNAGGAVRVYTILSEALEEVDQAMTAAEDPTDPPSETPGATEGDQV